MKFMKLWKNLKKEVHDVVEEPREEEVKPQVLEDMPYVEENMTTLNGNGDDKEDILVNVYGPKN